MSQGPAPAELCPSFGCNEGARETRNNEGHVWERRWACAVCRPPRDDDGTRPGRRSPFIGRQLPLGVPSAAGAPPASATAYGGARTPGDALRANGPSLRADSPAHRGGVPAAAVVAASAPCHDVRASIGSARIPTSSLSASGVRSATLRAGVPTLRTIRTAWLRSALRSGAGPSRPRAFARGTEHRRA
jgi:hypothetical protein